MPERWTKGPRPNQSCIAVAEDLLAAAKSGRARTMAAAIVNPNLEVEIKESGDLDHTKAMLLAAGLTKLAQKLLLKYP